MNALYLFGLIIFTENTSERMKIYNRVLEKAPRAQCPKRLPLNFLTGMFDVFTFYLFLLKNMMHAKNLKVYVWNKTVGYRYIKCGMYLISVIFYEKLKDWDMALDKIKHHNNL